jgi:hypothetical protein
MPKVPLAIFPPVHCNWLSSTHRDSWRETWECLLLWLPPEFLHSEYDISNLLTDELSSWKQISIIYRSCFRDQVDQDDHINYQLLIIYQLLILEGLLMIVDKVWKLTNTVRVGLDARSSHSQRQSTFPDNVCSYCPPCHGVLHYENLTTCFFVCLFICIWIKKGENRGNKKVTLETHHVPSRQIIHTNRLIGWNHEKRWGKSS